MKKISNKDRYTHTQNVVCCQANKVRPIRHISEKEQLAEGMRIGWAGRELHSSFFCEWNSWFFLNRNMRWPNGRIISYFCGRDRTVQISSSRVQGVMHYGLFQ